MVSLPLVSSPFTAITDHPAVTSVQLRMRFGRTVLAALKRG